MLSSFFSPTPPSSSQSQARVYYLLTSLSIFLHHVRQKLACSIFRLEPEFVNLLRCPGIDSQLGAGAGTTTLFDVSIGSPGYLGWRNRFLGSLKVFTNTGLADRGRGGDGAIIRRQQKSVVFFSYFCSMV